MSDPGSPAERIVISADDLDEPPAPTVPNAAPPPKAPAGGGTPLPPLSPGAPRISVGGDARPAAAPFGGLARPGTAGGDALTFLSKNVVIAGLIAGLLGGILGMVAAEVLWANSDADAQRLDGYFEDCVGDVDTFGDLDTEAADCLANKAQIDTGVWVLIVGAVLGAVLMAWEGITSGSPQRAARDGAIGAGAGAVAGFVGGYLAQLVYRTMTEDATSVDPGALEYRLPRMIGFAVFGVLLGGAIGLPRGSQKVLNGAIGGAVGGALGAFAFDQFAITFTPSSDFMLRFVGLAVTGAGIGVAIGVVDRLRRDSWIVFTSGPMTGKELILYKPESTIGTDYRCDVVVAKDKAVAPVHATFRRTADGTTSVTPAAAGVQVLVNGAAATTQRLRSGDVLTLGGSTLVFQERATQV